MFEWSSHTLLTAPSFVHTRKAKVPFFALIIGINDYQYVKPLAGAVADANAIDTYIQSHLGVPKDHIINLRNKAATRKAIIGGFRSLQQNPDIQSGDAIMIYYAGHGGEAKAPQGWEAGSDKIQVILPQDTTGNYAPPDRAVHPIPDRTIAALLNDLSREKGNNITVIFDCCHSLSGSRDDKNVPGRVARVVDIEYDLPPELDQDDRTSQTSGREAYVPSGFLQRDLRSHVFLAACGAEERAWETKERGDFTRAFLNTISTLRTDTVTYIGLMQRLPSLSSQNPQCEGYHRHRVLFDAKLSGVDPCFINIKRQDDCFTLDAGNAQGVTVDSQFSVYADHIIDSNSNPSLGTLRVKTTESFRSILEPLDSTAPYVDLRHIYGRLVLSGPGQELRVHFTEALRRVVPLDVILNSGTDIGFLPTGEDQAELIVSLDDDSTTKMVFSLTDMAVTDFGLKRLPHVVPATVNNLSHILRGAARWKWHLKRQPSLRPFSGRVHLAFTRLESVDDFDEAGYPVMRPTGEELNVTGVADLVVDPDHLFGIKITNDTKRDLHAYLFYFDVNNQRIESFYDGPIGGVTADPPLRAGSSLTIGYGAGGSVPIAFSLSDIEKLDVGFLKLFVTTSPVNLSSLEQPSPFYGERVNLPPSEVANRLMNIELWDTIMMTIVQRASPRGSEESILPMPSTARGSALAILKKLRRFFQRVF